jgi:hypothetical protein
MASWSRVARSPPSFPRLCDRMLHGKRGLSVVFVVFDVLYQGEFDAAVAVP